MFDDSWLEDKQALRSADTGLRRLAEAGARLRREIGEAEEPLLQIGQLDRPRAVIAAGSEARFIRAMLEPVCPVPVRRLARVRSARLGRCPRPRGGDGQ